MSWGLKASTSAVSTGAARGRRLARASLTPAAFRDPRGGGAHVLPAHAVFVEHRQRVAAPLHVDPREGAPRAADEKQAVGLLAHGLLQRLDLRLHRLAPGGLAALDPEKPQGAEG